MQGLPGTAGLPGIPGAKGRDGFPGSNGLPGLPGTLNKIYIVSCTSSISHRRAWLCWNARFVFVNIFLDLELYFIISLKCV